MNAMLLHFTSGARTMYSHARTTALCIAAAFLVLTVFPVGAQQPLPDPIVHLSFDDSADPGKDNSGNGRHGTIGAGGVDGAGAPAWVNDSVRGGSMAFDCDNADDNVANCMNPASSIAIELGDSLPGADFTVACWLKISEANAGEFFQIEPTDSDPSPHGDTRERMIWGSHWPAGFWGRVCMNRPRGEDDLAQLAFGTVAELDTWTHVTYRGRRNPSPEISDPDHADSDLAIFDVLINGEPIGPSKVYNGTIKPNSNKAWVGPSLTGGVVDDFRIYNIALSDDQVKGLTLAMLPEAALHLSFDDPDNLLADSSGNNVESSGEGETLGTYVDDPDRRGAWQGNGSGHICTPLDLAADSNFTIAMWAKQPDPSQLKGLFVMHREGGADGTGPVCQMEGSNDFRSWLGASTLWGRFATGEGFTQARGDDPSLVADEWTHIACRMTDTHIENLVNGQVVARYDHETRRQEKGWTHGFAGAERILLGNAHVGPWPGLLDDIRIYKVALTDAQIGNLLLPSPPQAALHLKFDDELDPLADSSGNNVVATAEGTTGVTWVDDDYRRGSMSFPGADGSEGYICVPMDIPADSEFTISMWAKQEDPSALKGLFVMAREGGADGTGPVCQIEGSNDFRSWLGASTLWGRFATGEGFTQARGDDPSLVANEWTHIACRVTDTHIENLVNGQLVASYDHETRRVEKGWTHGFAGAERILIGHAHVGSWNGLLDDVRVYKQALSDKQIGTIISGPCPADGDTHCLGVSIEAPPQRKRGLFRITADASDDSGDEVLYTYRAERLEGGAVVEEVLIEAVKTNEATLRLGAGIWTISVTTDDGPCPDVADDATCSVENVEVLAGEPSLDLVNFHFSFNDENDPTFDDSGNGYRAHLAPDGGVQWVNDAERGGVLEFQGIENVDNDPPASAEAGYLKVRDVVLNTKANDVPIVNGSGGGFTVCVWLYQFSQDASGAWGSGDIWTFADCCDDTDGELPADPQSDNDHDGTGWDLSHEPRKKTSVLRMGTTQRPGVDGNPGPGITFQVFEGDGAPNGANIGGGFALDTWNHVCLRGSEFDPNHPMGNQRLRTHYVDSVINGTTLPNADGDIPPHFWYRQNFGLQTISRVYLGKNGNRIFNGRLDDFRLYERSLTNEEIQEVMEGFVEPRDDDFVRGDADASGASDLSDIIGILHYLFLGGFSPVCLDALDFDGSTVIDVSDPINFLVYLFIGGFEPPAPGAEACGLPDNELNRISCLSFPPCDL